MKKFLSMILSLSLVLSLAMSFVACNKSDDDDDDSETEECKKHIDNDDDEKCDECGKDMKSDDDDDDKEGDVKDDDDDEANENPIPTTDEIGSTSAGLEFELNESGNGYILTGFGTCTAKDVVINKYNNKPVTEIAKLAFAGCTTMESITLGASVTDVEFGAFYASNCKSITVCSDNEVYYSIDGNLYSGKTLVCYAPAKEGTTFTIPSDITAIEDGAFSTAKSLLSLTIPSNVTEIGENAFSDYTSIVEIIDKSGLVDDNFEGLWSTTVHTGNSRLEYTQDGFVFFMISNEYRLVGYNGTSVDIVLPDYHKGLNYTVAESAFSKNQKIKSVIIPATLSRVGEIFYGCTALESVYLKDGVTDIGYGTFSGCTNLASVRLPDSLTEIAMSTFSGCTSLEEIIIPRGVSFIGANAFRGCNKLAIYCEAASQPNGWDENWSNGFTGTIRWNYIK